MCAVTPPIYTGPPDRRALEYLVNQVMRKSTERVEQDTAVDGNLDLGAVERFVRATLRDGRR